MELKGNSYTTISPDFIKTCLSLYKRLYKNYFDDDRRDSAIIEKELTQILMKHSRGKPK
jgi:hypothetical protein